jgi:3-deoxy-D-manno-octulosonic-acid transferase
LSRFFYSCIFYLAIPFALLRLLKRSLKEPGYRQAVSERFGYFQSASKGEIIWIHAVSAGETIAAVPLVERLVARGFPCLVTNMTPTGKDRVRALLGDTVENCYTPYDLPGAVNRFIGRNRPRMLIMIDTELWPNILDCCQRQDIKTAVVNGRMSERSANGYARISGLTKPMMTSLDLLSVQTKQHGARFESLGADPEKIAVSGSIKFDGQYSGDHEENLNVARRLVGDRPVLLGASTHEGEEEALVALLPVLQKVLSNVLLVLAPRHTHRCDAVEAMCRARGFQPARFSAMDKPILDPGCAILMLDVMGQLESYFSVSRLAFIGGSLVPVGGHNLLEAVRSETAVMMGPHLDNIEDIAQQFIDAGAMSVVHSEADLKDEVVGFMRDEGRVARMVDKANGVLEANRGSLDRVESLLLDLLDKHG